MPDILDVYRGDPVMAPAFAALVSWAFGEPGMREAFETDTGTGPLPAEPRSGLEAMIDDACGLPAARDAYVMGFAEWAFGALWGDPDQWVADDDDHAP